MSQTMTVNVPDTLVRVAQLIASESGRQVEAVLADLLDRLAADLPLEHLPDDQIAVLLGLQTPADEQRELSDILGQQREGRLAAEGRARLDALLGRYEQGLLLKAHAWKVAVERGLRPPLGTP